MQKWRPEKISQALAMQLKRAGAEEEIVVYVTMDYLPKGKDQLKVLKALDVLPVDGSLWVATLTPKKIQQLAQLPCVFHIVFSHYQSRYPIQEWGRFNQERNL